MIKAPNNSNEGSHNTGCYSHPPLKEISSRDYDRRGALETMKDNSMTNVTQGVHLVGTGW
jgi:hypothetical protein